MKATRPLNFAAINNPTTRLVQTSSDWLELYQQLLVQLKAQTQKFNLLPTSFQAYHFHPALMIHGTKIDRDLQALMDYFTQIRLDELNHLGVALNDLLTTNINQLAEGQLSNYLTKDLVDHPDLLVLNQAESQLAQLQSHYQQHQNYLMHEAESQHQQNQDLFHNLVQKTKQLQKHIKNWPQTTKKYGFKFSYFGVIFISLGVLALIGILILGVWLKL